MSNFLVDELLKFGVIKERPQRPQRPAIGLALSSGVEAEFDRIRAELADMLRINKEAKLKVAGLARQAGLPEVAAAADFWSPVEKPRTSTALPPLQQTTISPARQKQLYARRVYITELFERQRARRRALDLSLPSAQKPAIKIVPKQTLLTKAEPEVAKVGRQLTKKGFGLRHLATAGRVAFSTIGIAAILPGSGVENLVSGAAFEAGYRWFGRGLPMPRKILYGVAGTAAARLGMWTVGAISGKDDAYNTIEGLHPGSEGFGAQSIRAHSDFGSGYRGPNPWLQAEWHKREEVPKYTRIAPSKLGASEREIYKYLTEDSYESEYLAAAAMAGVAGHKYFEAAQYASGKAEEVERLVYDPEAQMAGFIDVVYPGGAPGDIKTVTAKRLEEVREKGAYQKHISQLNFYMRALDQPRGYLEYISREDPTERELVEVPYEEERYEKDIAKIGRVRSRILQELASGKLSPEDIQYGPSVQTMIAESAREQAMFPADASNLPRLWQTYQEELAYLKGLKFPGMPDRGFAPGTRESLTEFKAKFASRWDPVRRIAVEVFKGMEKEQAFKKLVSSEGFRSALARGMKRGGKYLGGGEMSQVRGYAATYMAPIERGGKTYKFEFAAKTDIPGRLKPKLQKEVYKAEKVALEQLGHLRAPSLYGTGKDLGLEGNVILMEKFKNFQSLEGIAFKEDVEVLKGFLSEAHKKGIAHTDLFSGNIGTVWTEAGDIELAILDWGMANRFVKSAGIGGHQPIVPELLESLSKVSREKLGREIGLHEYSQMADIARLEGYATPNNWSKYGINALYETAVAPTPEALEKVERLMGMIISSPRADVFEPVFTSKVTTAVSNKARAKFREKSQAAVGVGLRQAHNGGRRHGKFASATPFELADTVVADFNSATPFELANTVVADFKRI